REDVYEKMRKGNEDARMVVMHEIGHLVLHTPDQILLGFTQGKILVQCSEWQADTFAAETMAHHEYLPLVTKGAREFARLTGVPVPVAVKQWHHYEREGMKSK
ncbi:MAG TPA: hypothetical protein VEF76_02040, partial [Patescibacteria group bacterium]|nr:hypothetical protein [Patescibacteria group bacterium]